MNLALGHLDRLCNPPVPLKAKPRTEPARQTPIVGAYYTNIGAGVTPEKEYWQLVDAYKSWVYTCIDKLGKSIAMIPLRLYVYRSKQTGKLIRDVCWKANYRMLKTDEDRKYFLKEIKLEREEILEHPFLELISRPNPFMTRFTLWYNTIVRLELSGLCGWLKMKDNLKVTRQIFPLPLTKWASLKAKVTTTADLEYWEYRDGEVFQKFTSDQLFSMIYPHPASPFQGMSPLMAQTYPYDIDLFLMQQQRAFFEHGATPGLHLSTDQQLRKEQVEELREIIHEQYTGALKAGDTLITHSGLKGQTLGQTSRQSMIDEVARFSRDKLITSFDLSPAKIGLVEDVNRANMAGLDRTFIHECMRPKCMLVEESIESFFLPDYDKGLTCDFELPSTEDQEYELKAMETRLRTKVTVVNDERGKLGMDEVDWGKRPWGSFTDVQLGVSAAVVPKPVAEPTDGKGFLIKQGSVSFWTNDRKDIYWKTFVSEEEALEQIFLAPMRQYFNIQCEEVIQRLNREWNKVTGQYSGWSRQRVRQHLKENKTNLRAININEKDEREALIEKFSPVTQTIMKEYGDVRVTELNNIGKAVSQVEDKAAAFEFNVNDPRVLKWLGNRMRQFSREVAGTTFGEIEAILREGFAEGESLITVTETLRSKFESWEQYRAPLIARTETISAMNKSDIESVKQLELEDQLRKHWLSSRDNDVRDTHLAADKEYEAEGIKVDEEFDVGQDHMEAPGLGSLAEENINCFVSHNIPVLTDRGFKHIGDVQAGDFVLTHKGRFRKVLKTLEPKKYRGELITLTFKGNVIRLAVTPEHRFLVNGKWKPADKMEIGDRFCILSTSCPNCGRPMPYYRKSCSLSCNSKAITKRQWENPEYRRNISLKATEQMKREFVDGTRDRNKIIERARQNCFKKYGEKGYLGLKRRTLGFQEKIEEGIIRNWGSRKEMLCRTALKAMGHNARKGSKLEDRMVAFLDEKEVGYIRQFSVGNLLVDFYIPRWKNFVEVDGKVFHNDKKKERQRDLRILLEYPDHKISHVTYGVNPPKWEHFNLASLNHEKAYHFMNIEVIKIERHQLRQTRKLFNLAVEDDESYIVRGLVSHNCRCTVYYSEIEQGQGE